MMPPLSLAPRFSALIPVTQYSDTTQVKEYLAQANRSKTEDGWVFITRPLKTQNDPHVFLARTTGLHRAIRERLQAIRENLYPGYQDRVKPLLNHLLENGLQKEDGVNLGTMMTQLYAKIVAAMVEVSKDPPGVNPERLDLALPKANYSLHNSAEERVAAIADQFFPMHTKESIFTLLARLGVPKPQLDEMVELAVGFIQQLSRYVTSAPALQPSILKNRLNEQLSALDEMPYQASLNKVRSLLLEDEHGVSGMSLLRRVASLENQQGWLSKVFEGGVRLSDLIATLPTGAREQLTVISDRLSRMTQLGLMESRKYVTGVGILSAFQRSAKTEETVYRLTEKGRTSLSGKDPGQVFQITPADTREFLNEEIARLTHLRKQQLNRLKALETRFQKQREPMTQAIHEEAALRQQAEELEATVGQLEPGVTRSSLETLIKHKRTEADKLAVLNVPRRAWLERFEQQIAAAQAAYLDYNDRVEADLRRLRHALVEVDLTEQSSQMAALFDQLNQTPSSEQQASSPMARILAEVTANMHREGARADLLAGGAKTQEDRTVQDLIAQKVIEAEASERDPMNKLLAQQPAELAQDDKLESRR